MKGKARQTLPQEWSSYREDFQPSRPLDSKEADDERQAMEAFVQSLPGQYFRHLELQVETFQSEPQVRGCTTKGKTHGPMDY